MKAWLVETRGRTANGGTLAKAIDYSLRRWAALSRYAQTGDLPIDNNIIENAIRPIAIGKKTGSSLEVSVPEYAPRPFKGCLQRPNEIN